MQTISRRAAATAAAAALVVVIVVIVAIAAPRVRDYERGLAGFWSGDPTFLDEAGLAQMYLYVAPADRRPGRRWGRQGFLYIADKSGAEVCNQGVELSYGAAPRRWASAFKCHFAGAASYQIPAVAVSYDEHAAMPEAVRLGFDPAEGTLALFTADKVYAFLVRDNEASAAAEAGEK